MDLSRHTSNSGFTDWTPDRLPDLTGKRYLITGGNTGLGFEAAKVLAAENADIVIAARNTDRSRQAVLDLNPLGSGIIDAVSLDLSSLASVRDVAEEIRRRYDSFDAIVNNAGVMQTPQMTTVDGFELQFATNHLGHFLLNGLLFDLVENASGRIVVVSSIAHKRGQMYFDDLMLTENYSPTRAYCQSKLANLLYAFELYRRLSAAGSPVSAIACHPGYSATNLQRTGPRGLLRAFYAITNRIAAQSAEAGAIPLELAAAGSEALSGAYYGPTSRADMTGPVGDAEVVEAALDRDDAERLWSISERLTGFKWDKVLRRQKAA